MKCQECGSEKGFRGMQETRENRRPDGLIEREIVGPERIYCETCGAEVKKEEVKASEVLPEIPAHIREMGEQMLQGHGAPENVSEEEKEKLFRSLMESENR